jgi:hypothetical protein
VQSDLSGTLWKYYQSAQLLMVIELIQIILRWWESGTINVQDEELNERRSWAAESRTGATRTEVQDVMIRFAGPQSLTTER